MFLTWFMFHFIQYTQIQLLEFELLTPANKPGCCSSVVENRICECCTHVLRYFGDLSMLRGFFPLCQTLIASAVAAAAALQLLLALLLLLLLSERCRQSESFVNGILKTLTCYELCAIHNIHIFILQFGHGSPTQNTTQLYMNCLKLPSWTCDIFI